ncbi:MAG: sigma-70 family RNA polymerase sigma factor [Anaerolineales bacterium]|nr:sigma-70 family RNA polymerase sigma factor [Anaerolineales bacterium]
MDELSLLQAARNGDLDSFNRLVLDYQSHAYSFACRMLGEPEGAADAAQQAFVSAYRHLGELRGENFRSWLLRIVANACLDELRRRKRRPAVSLEDLSAGAEEDGSGESLSILADPAEGPETAAVRADLRRVLEDCLALLPPDQRATILLVDVHEQDYAEAARALRVALGTVKSRVARARADLRDCLRAKGELPPLPHRLESEASR